MGACVVIFGRRGCRRRGEFLVDDVDALHAEFVGRGVKISVEPVDQTWGTREMYVRDPDNNCIRFIQDKR